VMLSRILLSYIVLVGTVRLWIRELDIIRARRRRRWLGRRVVVLGIRIVRAVAVEHRGATGKVWATVCSRDIGLVGARRLGGLGGTIWLRIICVLRLLMVLSGIVRCVGGHAGGLILVVITTQCGMLCVCPERHRHRRLYAGRLRPVHRGTCSCARRSVRGISLRAPPWVMLPVEVPLIVSRIETRRAL
jgi:hypothetical protein